MPAIHSKILPLWYVEIEQQLFRRMLLHQIALTHRECMELLAPPEHHQMLLEAARFASVSASEGSVTIEAPFMIDGVGRLSVTFYARTHGQAPLRPRYPHWQIRTNSEVDERIIKWLTLRMENGRKAAVAKYVVEWLSDACSSGFEVRYLLPAVLHLCKGDDVRVHNWLQKHSAYRAVRSTPAIPVAMRKLIAQTSEWITQNALIGRDGLPEDTDGQNEVSVYAHGISSEGFWVDISDTEKVMLTRM